MTYCRMCACDHPDDDQRYIITEKQLQKTVPEAILKMDLEGLRSHPYNPQSEQDTILDKLLKHFDDDIDYNGWYVRKKLLELRQANHESNTRI
jgi:hypothetical protein